MNELLLIKAENEKLMEGQSPIVSPLDGHSEHIMEHRAVLADPDLRVDAALVKAVLDHIEEHVNALRNTDPVLLQMIGQQPLPPLAQPAAPGAPGPGGPNVPKGAVSGSPMPEMMSPDTGEIAPGGQVSGPGIENVNLPNLPKPPGQFKTLPVTAEQMAPPLSK